jgi:hypothetical protein
VLGSPLLVVAPPYVAMKLRLLQLLVPEGCAEGFAGGVPAPPCWHCDLPSCYSCLRAQVQPGCASFQPLFADLTVSSLVRAAAPHRGDLAVNLALGFTLLWLPLSVAGEPPAAAATCQVVVLVSRAGLFALLCGMSLLVHCSHSSRGTKRFP